MSHRMSSLTSRISGNPKTNNIRLFFVQLTKFSQDKIIVSKLLFFHLYLGAMTIMRRNALNISDICKVEQMKSWV